MPEDTGIEGPRDVGDGRIYGDAAHDVTVDAPPDAKALWGACTPRTWTKSTAKAADKSISPWRWLPPPSDEYYDSDTALLPDGTVLMSGGSAIYDPTSDSYEWLPRRDGPTWRAGTAVTALKDGRSILVTGGGTDGFYGDNSAWLLDLPTRTWRAAAPMLQGRGRHRSHLLASGRVLVIGGEGADMMPEAEIYDPTTDHWSAADVPAPWALGGDHDTTHVLSVQLENGDVIAVGDGSRVARTFRFIDAEERWAMVDAINPPRAEQFLVRLASGKVLGYGNRGLPVTAEVFDPLSNTWTSAPLPPHLRKRYDSAVLLPCGLVMVFGSRDDAYAQPPDLYDPAANRWFTALPPNPLFLSSWPSMLVLRDGRVMVTYGRMVASDPDMVPLFFVDAP